MDKIEAKRILNKELDAYRSRAYEQLVKLIDDEIIYEKTGKSSVIYQVEILVFWDDPSECDIRVLGSIDDGGWSAFSPMSDSFAKKKITFG